MSIVLKVKLEQRDSTVPTPSMILKVHDRLCSPQLREFKDTAPATSGSEGQFLDFVRLGSMPQFIAKYEINGPWGSWFEGQWDVPKREAYCYARSIHSHEVELEIYNRLVDLQGVYVPTISADVRLARSTPKQEETKDSPNTLKSEPFMWNAYLDSP
jgi:hypothetical protein